MKKGHLGYTSPSVAEMQFSTRHPVLLAGSTEGFSSSDGNYGTSVQDGAEGFTSSEGGAWD